MHRYAEAESLNKRDLAIREKVLGPEHPGVAQSLENYAALVRKTGRGNEAAMLEACAKAIRARTHRTIKSSEDVRTLSCPVLAKSRN